jgi:hypothetical protein
MISKFNVGDVVKTTNQHDEVFKNVSKSPPLFCGKIESLVSDRTGKGFVCVIKQRRIHEAWLEKTTVENACLDHL